jgi:hypothetical protein
MTMSKTTSFLTGSGLGGVAIALVNHFFPAAGAWFAPLLASLGIH